MRFVSLSSAVLLFTALALGSLSPVVAQTGLNSEAPAKRKTSQAKNQQFAEQFWNYLLSNNYKHWSPAPGKAASHFASQTVRGTGLLSPHGTNVKIYVNRTAASNPDSLPVGSVLILENYRQDKSLETISVMYRTQGFNPSANDWYWVNYNPDGSITTAQTSGILSSIDHNGVQQASAAAPLPRKLVGRSQACIECHKTGGKDLAFFNNRPDRQASIAPLVSQPEKKPASSFRPKVQPASALEQGSQQNFNMVLDPKTVIFEAP